MVLYYLPEHLGLWYVLFVLRFYGPVNPMGSCRARSFYLTMFTGQAKSSKRLTSIVHILSPETDNCPSLISGRERTQRQRQRVLGTGNQI